MTNQIHTNNIWESLGRESKITEDLSSELDQGAYPEPNIHLCKEGKTVSYLTFPDLLRGGALFGSGQEIK